MYRCTFIFVGIDPRLWKQAQLDNPDPEKYIPVPMIGFGEVRWRMKCQEQETKLHQAFLDRVAEDIAELQRRHTATVAKIAEYRHKFLELEHRVLQVCPTLFIVQGGSNMTGTDLCVNKSHCAAAVRP